MLRFSLFSLAIAGLIPSTAFAGNYGAAGCGLGAVVMGKDGNQLLAATTNATSGSQTLGITFGTLECGGDGLVRHDRAAQQFAEMNLPTLQRQAAAGGGEHLAAFAALNGCSAQQQTAVFARVKGKQVFSSHQTAVAGFRTAVAGLCSL